MYPEAIQELIAACEWDTVRYFFISENVFDPFIYYSHLTPLFLSLLIGLFIIWKNPRQLVSRILFGTTMLFSAWVFFDLILWATDQPHNTIFFWSLLVLVEPFIYAGMLYFIYVLLTGKDISLARKILISLPLVPTVALAFTDFSLYGYILSNCDREALEGPLAHYGYIVEIFYTLWIAVFAIEQFAKAKDVHTRKQIVVATVGVVLFLLTFSWGNIVGSFSDDWRMPQWGLFGMPVFIAFLGYLIVRYKTFNIKLLGAQALVVALIALIASMFLFTEGFGIHVLIGVTLALAVGFGWLLVKSVQREVEQRELIEIQEKELEVVNKQQENLLHFISHEVKGYLTESEVGFASISEGDYPGTPDKLREMAGAALKNVRRGVRTVMEILDASNLKKGTVNYKKDRFDLKEVVQSIVSHLKRYADEKGLMIDLSIGEGSYMMEGDEEKIKQHVVRNLIDNAIKYTPKGTIEVKLTDGEKIRFSVKDSGVGITPEDKKNLFTEGGHGKDSIKVNVHSTGYGLFIAKQVVDAHGGKIWAESEGQGKGSTFIVEFSAA